MDYLDVAIQLLEEAKRERDRYNKMWREIRKIPRDNDYWENRIKIESQFDNLPHKSVVNDNIKMARRLLLNEYM